MPYVESPLDRIVGVNFGGGAFTVGVNVGRGDELNTSDVFLAYNPGGSADATWTQTASLLGNPGDRYDNRAGVYGVVGADPTTDPPTPGTPTFLLAGLDIVQTADYPLFRYDAWIMASIDGGQSWNQTYTAEQGFVTAIVYDKTLGKFYAQASASAGIPDTDFNWIVLESLNGLSWTTIESVPAGGNSRYAPPIMTGAADPIYQDGDGHNCPGGVYGYDESKKILIAPYPDIPVYAYEARFAGDEIQIRTEDALGVRTTITKPVPGLEGGVVSVAFAGGVWQVSGFDGSDNGNAIIATSTDDGETWMTTYTGTGFSSSARIVLGANSQTSAPISGESRRQRRMMAT